MEEETNTVVALIWLAVIVIGIIVFSNMPSNPTPFDKYTKPQLRQKIHQLDVEIDRIEAERPPKWNPDDWDSYSP